MLALVGIHCDCMCIYTSCFVVCMCEDGLTRLYICINMWTVDYLTCPMLSIPTSHEGRLDGVATLITYSIVASPLTM